MPTGYTDIIYSSKGEVKFRDFALRCARAFGATIHQRDENLDSNPRLREVYFYHAEQAEKDMAELNRLNHLNKHDIAQKIETEYQECCNDWERSCKKEARLLFEYTAMLANAEAWEPPTKEHKALKQFMIDQIKESIRCDTGFRMRQQKPQKPNTDKWLTNNIGWLEESILRHQQEQIKENERVANANKWLDDLVHSLPR
jgi:hypothetical protein